MEKRNLLSLVKRDILYGFRKNLIKYGVFTIFLTIITLLDINNISQFQEASPIDLFFDLFKGVEYLVNFNEFRLPVFWFLINIFIIFTVGEYVYSDLKENGVYLLTRCKNRKNFWISKIIWIVLNVIVYYFMIFLVTLILGKIFLTKGMATISLEGVQVDTNLFLFKVIALYVTTSLTLSLIQVVLALWVKPIYAFLIVTIVIFIAIFTVNTFVPGQQSLILRNEMFDKVNNLTFVKSLIYNFVYSVILMITGGVIISKVDVI